MDEAHPSLPDEATTHMQTLLTQLIDATQLANGEYDDEDFSTEDVVAVLRFRANLFEEYGEATLSGRTIPDDYTPLEGLVRLNEDGKLESTTRRSYNMDVDFAIGIALGESHRELTPDQMARVLRILADHIEEYGRESLGSRESRSA